MTRPIIKIYDVVTQQTEEREMNDAEFAQYELGAAAGDAMATIRAEAEAAAQAKADAKAALLEKLGLTQDIIDILIN
jgi:hypothetical protein